ncbi:nuclear transport factor 2 family protein [Thalassospira sp.]|uniref:nuclear transport factor 2 family protein n=1 Tax=Thalassospira sp. TaxID=1912094 RepID=UPI0027340F6D|nr:nuclear transport factor 2 family protein [Thalassospira sp.]MDP2699999.1 nuclear transport factor 2 family protein [Thalassospira sp.]
MQNLPPVLVAYFDAANTQNVDAFVACFTPDAQVKDENSIHQGHENIAIWNRGVNKKYNCMHVVKSWDQTNGGADAGVEVSGTFPGSPVNLTFRFTLLDDKISALEIG